MKAGGLCRESQATDAVLLLTAQNPKAVTVCWEVLAASTVLVFGSESLGPPGAPWGGWSSGRGPWRQTCLDN